MRADSKLVLDSSAWIEYFEGSGLGLKVREILESESIIIAPNIVCAEVASVLARRGYDAGKAEEIMKSLSYSLSESAKDYFEAGRLHAEMRKKSKGTSLADAIVKTIAQKVGAKIVTGDFHLRGEGTIILGGADAKKK